MIGALATNFVLYARTGQRLDHWDPNVFLAALLVGHGGAGGRQPADAAGAGGALGSFFERLDTSSDETGPDAGARRRSCWSTCCGAPQVDGAARLARVPRGSRRLRDRVDPGPRAGRGDGAVSEIVSTADERLTDTATAAACHSQGDEEYQEKSFRSLLTPCGLRGLSRCRISLISVAAQRIQRVNRTVDPLAVCPLSPLTAPSRVRTIFRKYWTADCWRRTAAARRGGWPARRSDAGRRCLPSRASTPCRGWSATASRDPWTETTHSVAPDLRTASPTDLRVQRRAFGRADPDADDRAPRRRPVAEPLRRGDDALEHLAAGGCPRGDQIDAGFQCDAGPTRSPSPAGPHWPLGTARFWRPARPPGPRRRTP